MSNPPAAPGTPAREMNINRQDAIQWLTAQRDKARDLNPHAWSVVYLDHAIAAEEDAARVDWLEDQVAAAETKGVTFGGICYYSVCVGRKRIGEGDDVREAIDDARGVA